ncbi:MAG: SBBP repeat-containing protein [Acidobacteria bacterium]|nr:SBBP repeat-containing protein [Acidobacteriota bacterium]
MRRALPVLIFAWTAQAAFEPAPGGGFLARGARYLAEVRSTGFHVNAPAGQYALQFAGAAPVSCAGEDALAARSSYLLGRDPARWRTRVPQFSRVRCPQAYPGIDIVYYFTCEGLLEFDLDIAPGADAARVILHAPEPSRGFRLRKPVAWIEATRAAVEARFVPLGHDLYQLRTGGYDRSRRLTVDPVLGYSTYLGGTGGASGEAITTDREGNVYVAGTASSTTFPTVEAMQPFFAGSNDIFVSKFDSTGQRLIFSTYIGSWGDDRALSIKVDAAGRIYVAGYTTSVDFPVKNAVQEKFAGGSMANGGDAIVFALDPSGASLLFSTYLGGTLDDYARSLAIDKDGAIWVAGSTISQDFPLEKPLQDTYGGGTRDAFVFKLAPMGEKLLFSTYLGSGGVDEFFSVAAGSDGSACLVGTTTSTDLAVVEPFQPRNAGGARDVLIAKIRADLTGWGFLTYLGGAADDFGRTVALDAEDNLYITGYTTSGAFPRQRAFQNAYGTNRDAFLTKMTPDGRELVYSTYLGHNSTEEGWAVAVTAQGEAIVTGHTQSMAFPTVEPVQAGIGSACSRQPCTADLFVARFTADGSALAFSTYLGGTGAEQPRAIAVAPDGSAWITGYTASQNFPMVDALFPRHTGGGANIAFVAKIAF